MTGRPPHATLAALNPVEREDYHKIGCLEVGRRAGHCPPADLARESHDRSRVLDAVGSDFAAVSIAHVLAAARQGRCRHLGDARHGECLGMAAANSWHRRPEVLVLGGLMASAADLLLEPVRVEPGDDCPIR